MPSEYWDTLPEVTTLFRGTKWVCLIPADTDAASWQERLVIELAKGHLKAYEYAFEVGHGQITPNPHFHVYIWTAKQQRRKYLQSLLRQDARLARCTSESGFRTYIRKQQSDDFLQDHQLLLLPRALRFDSAGSLKSLGSYRTVEKTVGSTNFTGELAELGDLSQIAHFNVPESWEIEDMEQALDSSLGTHSPTEL